MITYNGEYKLAPAIRWRVLLRDNGTCADCKKKGVGNGDLHVHHIKHRSEGGKDTLRNLITLCVRCHRKRHKKPKKAEMPLRTMRMDDDVWKALKKLPMSPNQYLRKVLHLKPKV